MRYVSADKLSVGMELGTTVYDDRDSILVRAGAKITETLLNRLKKLDIHGLYINDHLGRDIEIEPLVSQSLKIEAAHALINKEYTKAIDYAKRIVEELSEKKDSLKVNFINETVKKNYTCHHAVNSCIYAVIIGLSLGLNEEQLRHLATAAILQDIGKYNISSDILHKKGKLTEDEYEQIKRHPRISYEIASGIPEVSSISRNAILFHHENIDGTGYYRMSADKQTYYTRIVHVADIFAALILDRPYRKAYSIADAVEMIMAGSGTMFAPEVVAAFVNRFPVYPLGITVKLSNGEKAIIANNTHSTLRPLVRVFNEFDDRLVDLFDDKNYLNVTIVGLSD